MTDYIAEHVSMPTLLEQLAEEATELAHACLKGARIFRGENPTPVTISEAQEKILEEWADVCLVADVLNIELDETRYDTKLSRWMSRLEEKK